MNKIISVLLSGLFVLLLINVNGCCKKHEEPQNPEQQNVPVQSSPSSDAAPIDVTQPETNEKAATAVKPYPLDYCLATGEKLGSMGEPVVRIYEGQEFKFCCAGCLKSFEKEPMKFVKLLEDAVAKDTLE